MFALAAVVVATLCGSSGCFGTTMLPFQGSADLIWSLRYPHAMSAFVVGALLALAGAPAKRRLILTGVMIASGFGALITLMLSLACDNALRCAVARYTSWCGVTLIYLTKIKILIRAIRFN